MLHLKPDENIAVNPLLPDLMKRADLANVIPDLHTKEERSFLLKVADQFIYIQKIALDMKRLLAKTT
jgi:hypothetical protein